MKKRVAVVVGVFWLGTTLCGRLKTGLNESTDVSKLDRTTVFTCFETYIGVSLQRAKLSPPILTIDGGTPHREGGAQRTVRCSLEQASYSASLSFFLPRSLFALCAGGPNHHEALRPPVVGDQAAIRLVGDHHGNQPLRNRRDVRKYWRILG